MHTKRLNLPPPQRYISKYSTGINAPPVSSAPAMEYAETAWSAVEEAWLDLDQYINLRDLQSLSSGSLQWENILLVSTTISVTVTLILATQRWFFGYKNAAEKPAVIHVRTPDQALPHWKGIRMDPPTLRSQEEPDMIQCYCPATGQFLGATPASTLLDIDAAIECAAAAQCQWNPSFSARNKVLKTIRKFLLENQEVVARVACRDTGKTMIDASMGEIMVTLEKINWLIKNGERALQPSSRPGSSNPLMFYKAAKVVYEPLGVVAALVSWNYPLHNLMGPILASLYAGNAVIIKCSESVVWSSQYFVQIAREALQACGHSPDLVQLVCCWPETANHLTSHPQISHVTFIGSKPVAHKVAAAAAESLVPLVVELGGKDPCVVFDDDGLDLKTIAHTILRGTFQAAGQNCIGFERVIAQPSAYKTLLDIFRETIPKLRVGAGIDQQDDVDVGACISNMHFDRLEELIADSVAQGAELVAGGHRYPHPKYPQGHYFQPTLLVGVTADMEIAQTEVFGPVLTMMQAETVDQAIDLANSTIYGLGAAVFGANTVTLRKAINDIKSGNIAVNDLAAFYVCQLPFGGCKGSGYGKFGGEEGLQGLCLAKSVAFDSVPFCKTTLPRPLQYPIPSAVKGWEFVKNVNIAGYGVGLWKRFKSLVSLGKSA
jgi:acyl-CoA reductase-like NAD-dependent aldehyde dehydrogenase